MVGRIAAALVLGAAAGCQSASPDSGLTAWMTVAEAQWAPGGMPASTDGPPVTSVRNARTAVWPGQRDKPLTGTVAREATAVAVALEGDLGYWVLPAGAPDVLAPGELTFAARLSFAATLPSGKGALLVRAVNGGGRFGPVRREEILVEDPGATSGALVVSLRWDTNADLDLHVVDPQGVEVWARNINSYQRPPPGQPEDPEAWRRGGILDHDSNAGCLIDGRRRETVVWAEAPPPGQYVVRVDPASLCGEPAARFVVEVRKQGDNADRASGILVEAQARGDEGKGAGIFALAFRYP